MRIIILISMLIASIANLSAQEGLIKDRAEAEALSKKVAEYFKDNKIALAFEELSWYWPIPQNEMEAMEEKTMKYLNLVNQRFGSGIDVLKVRDQSIGDDIAIQETYLVRFDHTAIRLIFIYYKSSEGYIVNAFKWDDSFEEEFK